VPLQEGAVPVVDYGDAGPIRCIRCRTYINPFFSFLDGGRSFQCNLCGMVNPTPSECFCELDQNGYRRDHAERPELCRGVVEFIAPPEYQARPPAPPPIVCLVEASYGAVSAGILQAVLGSLVSILASLPPDTRFAIVTFDDTIHFYEAYDGGGVRQLVVADTCEICLPLPPEALLQPLEEGPTLDERMQTLATLCCATKNPNAALGAALEACHLLLEPTGGRLLLFQHTLPSSGPMKLLQRDDVRQYGTDKEKALLQPLDDTWGKLAAKMAAAHICCSTFHFANGNFIDLASQGMLSRVTGGQLYLYTNCVPEHRDEWSTKLQAELARNLMRTNGFEGVMRFRCSKGLRVDEYLMGSAKPGDLDVAVAGIDADSAFGVTFRYDDKLEEAQLACVQCALLYTTASGERRIRVLTLGFQVTSSMASLFRYADLDALTNILMRQAALATAKQTLHQVREAVVTATVSILYTYRKMCASSTAAGQLILPESLKLLPLYALSLTKNALLRAGTDVRADERAALIAMACRMPVASSVAFVYPRLFALETLEEDVGALDASGAPTLPQTLPLSLEKLESDGAFLLDDAVSLFLWLGRGVTQDFLEAVLQVRSMDGVDCSRLRLYPVDNSLSIRVNRLVSAVRSQRPHLLQSVRVLVAKDPFEGRFLSMLTDDRAQASMSYVEFLCHIHRQIQSKTS
jgi:protein transport protein SEC24